MENIAQLLEHVPTRENLKHSFELFGMFKLSLKVVFEGDLVKNSFVKTRLLEMRKLCFLLSQICKRC